MKEHEFDPSVDTPDTESLLRLARTLVEDADQAEDLVQDVWVRALSRLREVGDAGAYLRTAVRRGVHRVWRDRDRRERREASASPPREIDGPLGTLETDEFRAIVAGAVESLSEPYRETVRLSFYEELTPSEIAVRSSLPAGTVRSRLKRGLDQLRVRLDRRYGRTAWTQGFALVLTRETGIAPSLSRVTKSASGTGAGASVSPWLYVAVGVLAVFGATRALETRGSERGHHRDERSLVGVETGAAGTLGPRSTNSADRLPLESNDTARAPERGTNAPDPTVASPGAPAFLLHVVDADMQPIRGVRLLTSGGETELGRHPVHPGASEGAHEVVPLGDSPVVLPRSPSISEPESLLVGAEGYEWTRVLIDRSVGAASDAPDDTLEQWVVLGTGARLRIDVTGFVPASSTAEFQLAIDAESGPLVREPLDSTAYDFGGLPSGPVLVRAIRVGAHRLIDIGENTYSEFSPADVLAEASVVLDPERTSVARLQVPAPAASAPPVLSTVAVDLPPSELHSRRVSLRIAPKPGERADETSVPIALAEDGLVRQPVHVIEVTPGSHEVYVYPVLHYEVREFSASESVRISVPTLARVVVRVDPDVGADALLFRRILDERHVALTSQWDVDPDDGECVATVVPGRYVVEPLFPQIEHSTESCYLDITIGEGTHSFDFADHERRGRPTSFLLRFRAGNTRIPLSSPPMLVEPVGHAGRPVTTVLPEEGLRLLSSVSIAPTMSRDDAGHTLGVDTPGLYRFGAFRIPPYLPVAPRIVEAREGEVVTVEYSLELPPR